MELEFDVKVNSKVLYDYMLHHTYGSFQGVLGTAVGAIMLVGFGVTGYVIWLIAGIVLLAYLPWTLFLRSKQQMLKTPAFQNPLHYRMTEEGVEISQGEAKEFQKWEHMHKAVAVIEMLSKHLPPAKVKIRW